MIATIGRRAGRQRCSLTALVALALAGAAPAAEIEGKLGSTQAQGPAPAQIIVRYKDETPATHAARAEAPRIKALLERPPSDLRYGRSMSGLAHVLVLRERSSNRAAAEAAVAQLRADPAVLYAEIDEPLLRKAEPTDPLYIDPRNFQWNLRSVSATNPGGANLPPAWDWTTGNALIGLVDSGWASSPDVVFGAQWDFVGPDPAGTFVVANDGNGRDSNAADPGDWITAADRQQSLFQNCPAANSSWHGLAVAGVMSASQNNGQGISGVAPNAGTVMARALGKCFGYTSDVADALRFIGGALPANGQKWSDFGIPDYLSTARIVNLSLGTAVPGTACGPTLQAAIDAVRAVGTVVIAATGNEGATSIGAPANCRGAIGVTAHTIEGDNADYSNVGPGTALSAPGGGNCTETALSCLPHGNQGAPGTVWRHILTASDAGTTSPLYSPIFAGYVGTSMAAAHVAGAASLLRSVSPALAPDQIAAALAKSARPFPAGTYCAKFSDGRCGAGMLDVGTAVSRAAAVPATSLAAAILPISRSVRVGTEATIFATVINTGTTAAEDCAISTASATAGDFYYQTTDPATNALTGTRNALFSIPPGGLQTFVLSVAPGSTYAPTEVAFNFLCLNSSKAPSLSGLNRLLLSGNAAATPDVIAIAATANRDGIVTIPGFYGSDAFATAVSNVGAAGSIRADAVFRYNGQDIGLPISILICQTNAATGACIGSPQASVTTTVAENATATFAIFVAGTGYRLTQEDLGTNRIFVRFFDGAGVQRGGTSVALRWR